jgi:hypothetical protein
VGSDNICTDPKCGFTEFHSTTLNNALLPKKLSSEGATGRVLSLPISGGLHHQHVRV